MDNAKDKMKADIDKKLQRLRELRDEAHLKGHLAKMDVKDRWAELEPRVNAMVDKAEKNVASVSKEAMTDTIHALEKLRDSI